MQTKKVSIIIPVKPGGKVKALEALQKLDYPVDAMEIIVAEGRCPSRQRNLAAAAAGGEIICFLDDDSMVGARFLHQVAGHYDDPVTAAVGGPSLTPATDPALQQGFGLALASLFGSGGVRNRYRQSGKVRKAADNELILCNLSMRREVFRAFGGFDERLYPNEENELLERIRKEGLTLLHDPELVAYRSQRRNLRAFIHRFSPWAVGPGKHQAEGERKLVPAASIYLCASLYRQPAYYLPPLLPRYGFAQCVLRIGTGGKPALRHPVLSLPIHIFPMEPGCLGIPDIPVQEN
jgi:hypothetical protein